MAILRQRHTTFAILLVYVLVSASSLTSAQTIRWIPVVYHSIGGYISTIEQINSNINMMNAAYSNTLNPHDGYSRDPNCYSYNLAADAHVQFFLAKVDIDGNPFTEYWINETFSGVPIHFLQTDDLQDLKDAAASSLARFPTDKYLNIFCVQIEGANGWCDPNSPLDAVLVNQVTSYPSTAHEAGHWFGLEHPTTPEALEDDVYNMMYHGSLQKACIFIVDQVGVINSWLGDRRLPAVHIGVPSANRVWVDGGTGSDLGGTLTVNGQQFTSTGVAKVPPARQFPAKTDHQMIGSRQHLMWNGNPPIYKMLRQINYGGQPPPSEEKAEFTTIAPVTVNISVEGTNMDGQVEFRDPWFVEDEPSAYQPDNNWKTYATGFKGSEIPHGGVLLGRGSPPNWAMPYYSARVQPSQTLVIGGRSNVCDFVQWNATNATVQNALFTQTGVFFQADASVLASYKARLRTNTPSLSDAKNQRRLLHESGTYRVLVYESMGDIWLTATRDGGSSWWPEERLNLRAGYGSNPTLSNIVYYNYQACAVVSWIEQNPSGNYEVHFQSLRIFTGVGYSPHPVWYGFSGTDRSAANNVTFATIGDGIGLLARPGALPVLNLILSGSTLMLNALFERSGSGIWRTMEYIDLGGGQDLSTGSWDELSPVEVSTNASDICPVFIKYPAAMGSPALQKVYYLGAGFDYNGLRVIECDAFGGNKTVLPKGYSESTYSSLQSAVNAQAASYVVVAQGDAYNGKLVNLYTKPTCGVAASLTRCYLNMYLPTVMVENVQMWGSPASTILMKGTLDNTWYSSPGLSGTLSSIGTTINGFFLREQTPGNDKISMVCRNNVAPSLWEVYSGSGTIGKVTDNSVPITRRELRFWKSEGGLAEGKAVLTSDDADVTILDSLQNTSTICALSLKDLGSSGAVLQQQEDSLATALGVELVRNGVTLRAFAPAIWTAITTTNLPSLRAGDIVKITRGERCVGLWGYEQVSVRATYAAKMPEKTPATALIPIVTEIAAYPNPFNPSVTLQIALPEVSQVRLEVFDLLGRLVATVANGTYDAGYHQLTWDTRGNGEPIASGIYFSRLVVNDATGRQAYLKTTKLLLAK